jgi:hypothetical protein
VADLRSASAAGAVRISTQLTPELAAAAAAAFSPDDHEPVPAGAVGGAHLGGNA